MVRQPSEGNPYVLPWESAARTPIVRLVNRPDEVLHNHDSAPCIEYAGYCQTAPTHHLWRCTKQSDPPHKVVELVPFDQSQFSDESKAWRGGCSMRLCPGDAVMMRKEGHHAYCERHALHAQRERKSCPWTSITPCPRAQGLEGEVYVQPCPTCKSYAA